MKNQTLTAAEILDTLEQLESKYRKVFACVKLPNFLGYVNVSMKDLKMQLGLMKEFTSEMATARITVNENEKWTVCCMFIDNTNN
jgi:hypothetical protein